MLASSPPRAFQPAHKTIANNKRLKCTSISVIYHMFKSFVSWRWDLLPLPSADGVVGVDVSVERGWSEGFGGPLSKGWAWRDMGWALCAGALMEDLVY